MPPDSPARLVYDASLAAYSASDSGDHSLPTGAALTAADGWSVYYHSPSEPGVTPWPAQIKADLHTIGLQHEWQRRTAFRSEEIDEWRRIVKQELT